MKIALLQDTPGTTPWWSFYAERCKQNGIKTVHIDPICQEWWKQLNAFSPHAIIWRGGQPRPWHDHQLLQRLLLHFDLPDIPIYPPIETHYLYETKILQTRLFQRHGIPHPATYITYDYRQAFDFLSARKTWPVVIKTSEGAGSSGVYRVHEKKKALAMITAAFKGEGIKYGTKERAKGYAYIQEYIDAPNGIIRISTFGNPVKTMTGFWLHNRLSDGWTASSGNRYTYEPMPDDALILAKTVAEKLGLLWNMIDFIKRNGKWTVLELSDTCGLSGTNSRTFTYHVSPFNDPSIVQRREKKDFRYYIWDAILADLTFRGLNV